MPMLLFQSGILDRQVANLRSCLIGLKMEEVYECFYFSLWHPLSNGAIRVRCYGIIMPQPFESCVL
jgi:hypothetical protein